LEHLGQHHRWTGHPLGHDLFAGKHRQGRATGHEHTGCARGCLNHPGQMTVPPSASNLAFVEGLYADYARDPGSVPPEWRDYFRHFPNGDFSTARALPRLKPSFRAPTLFNPAPRNGGDTTTALEPARLTELQDRINQLIRIYRIRGHIIARVDPLRQPRRSPLNSIPRISASPRRT